MRAGLDWSVQRARNEEETKSSTDLWACLVHPCPFSLTRGGGRKLIETSHGITEQSLPWKECLLSVFSLRSIYLKPGYGHGSEIIHTKRGFEGPNNYPVFITKEKTMKNSLVSNSRFYSTTHPLFPKFQRWGYKPFLCNFCSFFSFK